MRDGGEGGWRSGLGMMRADGSRRRLGPRVLNIMWLRGRYKWTETSEYLAFFVFSALVDLVGVFGVCTSILFYDSMS